MYTPLMSSTPGIGLTPNVSGFNPADAEFTWNASYGHFLDWSPPNYTVSEAFTTRCKSWGKGLLVVY